MALALHAALVAAVRWQTAPRSWQPMPDGDAAVELSLADERATPSPDPSGTRSLASEETTSPAREHSARARSVRREQLSPTAVEIAATDAAQTDASANEGPVSQNAGQTPSGNAAPHGIDLGLNGGVRRAALGEGWLAPIPRPTPPSDGGLSAGLAALDAERGLSRSSPAHHAAYLAARLFAPLNGRGIFDIVTDERGSVLSVTLASAPTDEARWQRVGQELEQLLKDRRLRVPKGAKGLAARLGIETGELAKDIAERFRSKRGAALGQGPVHPREMRAESTRESLEPGKLSPTLGVTVAGGGSGGSSIRIVLLSERAL
jgi:hypothetical protein